MGLQRHQARPRQEDGKVSGTTLDTDDRMLSPLGNNTSCWHCSVSYPVGFSKCPECGCANANEDMQQALRELYPDDDGDPYCSCGNDPYEEEDASGVCSSCGKELP